MLVNEEEEETLGGGQQKLRVNSLESENIEREFSSKLEDKYWQKDWWILTIKQFERLS